MSAVDENRSYSFKVNYYTNSENYDSVYKRVVCFESTDVYDHKIEVYSDLSVEAVSMDF